MTELRNRNAYDPVNLFRARLVDTIMELADGSSPNYVQATEAVDTFLEKNLYLVKGVSTD